MHAQLLQSCPTLCDPMDCSLPGFSVRGILQTRTVEWVAMPSSRGSSDPGIEPASPALQGDLSLLSHRGRPISKMKRQSTGWEKIFANNVTNKGLISRINE